MENDVALLRMLAVAMPDYEKILNELADKHEKLLKELEIALQKLEQYDSK